MAAVPEEKLNYEIQQQLADEGHVNTVFGRAQKVGDLRILPVVEIAVSLADDDGDKSEARLRPIGMVVVDGGEACFTPLVPSDETARESMTQICEAMRQRRAAPRQPHRSGHHPHHHHEGGGEHHGQDNGGWDHGDRNRDRDRDGGRDGGRDRGRDRGEDRSRCHDGDRPPGSGWGPPRRALRLRLPQPSRPKPPLTPSGLKPGDPGLRQRGR